MKIYCGRQGTCIALAILSECLFCNKNEQDQTINKEVITKKNFYEQKNFNFVLIYKFLINGSSVVKFGFNVLANINFMGKIQRKYQKSQKLTKFTLKEY